MKYLVVTKGHVQTICNRATVKDRNDWCRLHCCILPLRLMEAAEKVGLDVS